MAIITDVICERGHRYPSQYVRVDRVHAGKTTMVAEMGVYFTQQQAADGEPPHRVETVGGDFDMNSPLNAWQQAYALAKARWPEAVDA